jgi:hypothetical protein
MQQGKQMGMTSKWMGTFWTMDSSTVMKMGEGADGFMGVMPYRYYYDTDGQGADAREDPRAAPRVPEHGLHAGLPDGDAAHRGRQAHARRRQAADGKNLKAALNTIKDFDTGGLIGTPLTIKGNSIPVGRIYKADMKAQKMVPASDWIALSDADGRAAHGTARPRVGSSVNNIEVVYNKVVQVLRGLSLARAARQIVALLGSNGAGQVDHAEGHLGAARAARRRGRGRPHLVRRRTDRTAGAAATGAPRG